jgi:hypothetical protein
MFYTKYELMKAEGVDVQELEAFKPYEKDYKKAVKGVKCHKLQVDKKA